MKQGGDKNNSLSGLSFYWPSLLLTGVLFTLWEVAMHYRWINPLYMASPSGAAKAFWELVSTGEIWPHVTISFFRIAVGWALGSIMGIIIGVLTGGFQWIRRAFEPIINALYGAPKVAILPLLIILMGIGELPKIVLIAITAFFSLWINTHTGMQNIDTLLVRVARNFGAAKSQILFKVEFPSILPYLFVGFRLSAGNCLVMVIAAEFLAAKSGLGFLVDQARETYQLERLICLILLFGILSFLLTRAIHYTEKKMTRWKEKQV